MTEKFFLKKRGERVQQKRESRTKNKGEWFIELVALKKKKYAYK